jgi:hypothetical protein
MSSASPGTDFRVQLWHCPRFNVFLEMSRLRNNEITETEQSAPVISN